jgi:hypothetical protein
LRCMRPNLDALILVLRIASAKLPKLVRRI